MCYSICESTVYKDSFNQERGKTYLTQLRLHPPPTTSIQSKTKHIYLPSHSQPTHITMPSGYQKHNEAASAKTRRGGNSKPDMWNPKVGYRDKKEVQKVSSKKASSSKKWMKQLMR